MSNFASTKSSNNGGNKYRSSFAGKNMKQPFLHQTDASMSTMAFEDMNALFRMDEADSRDHKSAWVKLNKTLKKEKLSLFSVKYATNHNLDDAKQKMLCDFLTEKVDAGKLNRAKDVVVDKNTHDIVSIPSLLFHPSSEQFCLRTIQSKRPQNVLVGNSGRNVPSRVAKVGRKVKGAMTVL